MKPYISFRERKEETEETVMMLTMSALNMAFNEKEIFGIIKKYWPDYSKIFDVVESIMYSHSEDRLQDKIIQNEIIRFLNKSDKEKSRWLKDWKRLKIKYSIK